MLQGIVHVVTCTHKKKGRIQEEMKRVKKLWKSEDFRLHVAREDRKWKLAKCAEQIERLQLEKKRLEETDVKAFAYSQGDSVNKLKTLLDWDDETTLHVVKTFERKRNVSSARSFVKLLDAIFTL